MSDDDNPVVAVAAPAPVKIDPRDVRAEAALTERAKDPGKRLFVGFRVAVPCANALVGAVETLARRARDGAASSVLRWVPPPNYHVTLKYLGFTREPAVLGVRDAIAKAVRGTAPLRVKIARLGAFPSPEAATVVWAGVEDVGGGLAALAATLDAACAALGYAPEPRPFRPHVTLARLREPRAMKDVLLPLGEQGFGETRVEGITLFWSEPRPTGAIYRDAARVSFAAAPRDEAAAASASTSPAIDLETEDGWPRGYVPLA